MRGERGAAAAAGEYRGAPPGPVPPPPSPPVTGLVERRQREGRMGGGSVAVPRPAGKVGGARAAAGPAPATPADRGAAAGDPLAAVRGARSSRAVALGRLRLSVRGGAEEVSSIAGRREPRAAGIDPGTGRSPLPGWARSPFQGQQLPPGRVGLAVASMLEGKCRETHPGDGRGENFCITPFKPVSPAPHANV